MLKAFNPVKIVTALFFLIAGAVMLYATFEERSVIFAAPDELGPMTYPRYLITGWLALSVMYLFKAQKPFSGQALKTSLPGLVKVTLCIALYIFLFGTIGLIMSTAVFLLIFLPLLGMRKPLVVIGLSALCSALTWVVFVKALGVAMPPNLLLEFFR